MKGANMRLELDSAIRGLAETQGRSFATQLRDCNRVLSHSKKFLGRQIEQLTEAEQIELAGIYRRMTKNINNLRRFEVETCQS